MHILHRFININAEFTPDINKIIIECEWQRNERNFNELHKLKRTSLFSIYLKLNKYIIIKVILFMIYLF